MSIALYPTETVYALGVAALDEEAVRALCEFKGRDERKVMSWLVRDMADVSKYGEASAVAAKIAKRFLPGSLTLVIPAKDNVPTSMQGEYGTIGFRISPDPVAQQVIADFMAEHDSPLTCTSANVSGFATRTTVFGILEQFGDKKDLITNVVDDGIRAGTPSTIVRVIGDEVSCIRDGAIPFAQIQEFLRKENDR